MCPHPAHSVDIPVGMLWAHNWPHLWPTLLCVGQPTVNPHFELSRLGPTRAPQSGGHICPTFHAGLGAQSGLPTWVRFSTRNGPTLAPSFFILLWASPQSIAHRKSSLGPEWANCNKPHMVTHTGAPRVGFVLPGLVAFMYLGALFSETWNS